VLGQAAHVRTARVVVFVVDGETLKAWSDYGYDAGPGVTDLPVHGVTRLAAALAAQTMSTFRAGEVESDTTLPEFLRPDVGHVALLAPLSVGGDVVAIVYAEGPAGREARAPWIDEVELVARYARTRLESVTSERTVSALTRMA
jgi:hypothetical protein